MTNNWFNIDNVEKTDTPFLALFPERVKDNIRALQEMIPEKARLRPHVKTNKCKEVVRLMIEAGIFKFKCATIAEAEMLALTGASDVLLAYQPVGPKIKRLLHLMTSYPATRFSCLVDNEVTAREIAAAAMEHKLSITVYLDLNVGMNRTGIPPEDALDTYRRISEMDGILVAGLHAYDGHVTKGTPGSRKKEVEMTLRRVGALSDEIIKSVLPLPGISAGSTPTLQQYAVDPDAECSPGTFIYWDQTYQELYAELPFKPAVLVVTRVISRISSELLCLDLGYKAISSESGLEQRVRFLNFPDAEVISQSEEHMVIKVAPATGLTVGDVLYGVPYHIGRTSNLYRSSYTIYDHRITGEWSHSIGR